MFSGPRPVSPPSAKMASMVSGLVGVVLPADWEKQGQIANSTTRIETAKDLFKSSSRSWTNCGAEKFTPAEIVLHLLAAETGKPVYPPELLS